MPNSLPVPSGSSFSQNSAIAFSILIGFIVFITCRGELGAYFSVFLGTGGAGDNPGAIGQQTAGLLSTNLGNLGEDGSGESIPFEGGEGFSTGFGDIGTGLTPFGGSGASGAGEGAAPEIPMIGGGEMSLPSFIEGGDL